MVPSLATKAEPARIGRCYAGESMLVLNPETGLYDADATPETGADTVADYQARLIPGRSHPGTQRAVGLLIPAGNRNRRGPATAPPVSVSRTARSG